MASRALYSPRHPMLKKRDGFEDILEERRRSSDLRYALRCYTPTLYKGLVPCKASMLKSIVLQSDHLQYVIKQVSSESGDRTECVAEEASLILDEMAHRLQLSTVRFFAFMLNKAFKRLFRSVCVNEEGIQRLQQAVQEHPVVLLPSHRSYMDFLMMSYLLYMYDLPLPVIAAGMDFMSMKFVGEMLRMSGAFFIRRSFGGDKLYWAVFSEYVKTMLRNGYAPIEFFLEGTRSRTCKSLTPKTGLLNIVMEPFFKGELFDVNLVPVSISYERILEESLYARELLGIPKPKESTSGLLKARRVLSEDYGSMYVYFGHPVSVRSLTEGKITRSQYNLLPRYDTCNQPRSECFALKAYIIHTKHLNFLPTAEDYFGVRPRQSEDHRECGDMTIAMLQSRLLLIKRGGVPLPMPRSSSSQQRRTTSVYGQGDLRITVRASPSNASPRAPHSSNDVYNCFNFLRNMFSNEFILCPGDSVQDFEEACYLLMKRGVLQVSEHEIVMSASGHSTLAFLSSVLDPFLQGYQVVSRYLCEETNENLTEKEFIPAVRNFALKLILAGRLKCYEALSSDLQKNALAAFLRLKGVRKVKVGDQVTLKVNKIAVNSLEDTLGKSDVISYQNSWCSSMAMFEIAI
uniref:Dihydroxyacetone phosphate acyltransferase-like n=1 Tax=Sinocyclocheilus anshuiensis TaxID=1608454 RepID=A0A671QPC3_9TELE